MPGITIEHHPRDIGAEFTSYTLSQSWLNTLQTCPEQARRELVGDIGYTDTDATVIGSAVHTYIETFLYADDEHAILAATEYLYEHWDDCTKVKVKTVETALKRVLGFAEDWLQWVYPQLGTPIQVEGRFRKPIWTCSRYDIWLAGTVDFQDQHGIWDWKTTSSRIRDRYGDKEVARKIQPTAYLWALQEDTFHYAVLSSREAPAIITTTRTEEDMSWLKQRCIGAVELIRADAPVWPYNDSSPLCSEQWCPVYSSCKGRHYD